MSKVFKSEDYNSNDGMLTYIWGPALWHTLHTMSFNYPVNPTKEQKESYYNYFISLKNVLPCKYCRDNYAKNLEKLPLTASKLKNRETFSRWVFDMHELINKNLNKKSNLTYEIVRDRYEHFRSRCLIDPKVKINDTKEKGCTEPLYGVKSKCVINIVPKNSKKETFKIDKKCKISK
jgi:hypothetical protein